MVINIRIDEEFKRKLEYLQRINGYRSKSDTIRKIVEKEYRKESENWQVPTEVANERMTEFAEQMRDAFPKVGSVHKENA